jgi:hypothetical protein
MTYCNMLVKSVPFGALSVGKVGMKLSQDSNQSFYLGGRDTGGGIQKNHVITLSISDNTYSDN